MKDIYTNASVGNRMIRATYAVVMALFLCIGATAHAQNTNTASGVIVDSKGQPLVGATIIVKGSSVGATTDLNGKFTIKAPTGATLIFQYIGYLKNEVKASTNMRVILIDDAQSLEEVVVLGYGTSVKRADVIGSVASISADKISERAPVSVLDALQGQMAGVQITSNSGAPGDGVSIRVRGVSTTDGAGTAPLYVVDGVIMEDINSISPSDILSIDVLKDAASASIYGSRAANGVVMVTTKSASSGKPRIDLRYNQTFGFLSNKLPQLNRKEADIISNTIVSANSKDQFNWFRDMPADSCNLINTTSNDYQKVISQVAKRTEFGMSASGSSDKIKYFTSLNYLNNQGVILTSYQKRTTGRLNVAYTPFKFMTVTTNLQLTYEDKNNISEGNTFYNAIRRMPQTALYVPADGEFMPAWGTYPNSGKRNPLIEIYEREDLSKRYAVNIYEGFDFKIMKGLTFRVSGSAAYYYDRREGYSSAYTNTGFADYQAGKNSMSSNKTFSGVLSGDAVLDYSTKFGEDHNFHVMLGGSAEDREVDVTRLSASYLLNDGKRVPQASNQADPSTVTGYGNSQASVFGRVDYNYKSRYLVSFTMRRDGSSRFGVNNRYGNFPSAQVGWRFSDLFAGTKTADILTDAKLRASWGIVGNDRIGNTDAMTLLESSVGNGYNGEAGTIPDSKMGNPNIMWEETTSTNIGADLTFLGGRFSVMADYYVKTTKNLLDNENLPPELGYESMRVNVGSMKNSGFEIAISGYPVKTRNWSWMTNVNWSYNKNRVVEIAKNSGTVAGNGNWWVQQGMPAGLFYGFKNQGVYAYDVSNAYTPDYKTRLNPVFKRDSYNNVMFDVDRQPILIGYQYPDGRTYNGSVEKMRIAGSNVAKGGDVIWDDYNRDGDINDNDKQILGSGYPDWFAGWTNTVMYKQWSFNFSLYFSQGGMIYNQLLYDLSKFGDNTSACDPRAAIQGWRFQGQQTDWYAPGNKIRPTDNGRQLNSAYLEDASFIRLQNVRLSYMFTESQLKRFFIKGLQLFVYGNNLLTWTNYRGYDPEISTGGVLNPGADTQKYPKKREIGFGANINF